MIHLENRLKEKEKELSQRKEYFKIMVENEIDMGTFEKNAITELVLMHELKTEIKELKHNLLFLNASKNRR